MGLLWLVVGELVVLLTNLLIRAELRTEGGGGGEQVIGVLMTTYLNRGRENGNKGGLLFGAFGDEGERVFPPDHRRPLLKWLLLW